MRSRAGARSEDTAKDTVPDRRANRIRVRKDEAAGFDYLAYSIVIPRRDLFLISH
jgi:hypothetical protein